MAGTPLDELAALDPHRREVAKELRQVGRPSGASRRKSALRRRRLGGSCACSRRWVWADSSARAASVSSARERR